MSKFDPEQSSNASDTVKPTIWRCFKAHMKKWWWLYAIAVICIFLVIFLPIIYVGIPHLADEYINNYQYNDTGLSITNPRPSAFHMSQSQKISIGGGLSGSGHLSAFNATISTSDGQEFAVLPLSEIKFSDGPDLKIDQDLELTCVDCLSDMAAALATNDSISMVVKGHPDLKIGALPTAHLNIDKTMQMNGYNITEFMNSNGAFNITSVELLTPEVDGYNFNATISLRNPTPFSVEMGNVVFNLSMGGSSLGYIDMPNLTFSQGVSNAVVLGQVDESMLVQEALLGDGDVGTVTIDIQGYSCHYNGQAIPYFAAAIRASSASVTVNLLEYASSLFD
ncbi:uncharacterized protein N7503_012142 [Penicillium pulvis]|uniref:uncharacterized protein n=1 Tax=Penicillium pulvis TaxID=1562058 RepID=UPI002549AB08|nr:uncharacterized protein N7503_012142 [Penicillium pulvis]KAJ5786930.1 hypothetical protein N7503_012142 [Penicillium pulvis]